MKQYTDAVREILRVGTRKENRTGVDTLSTFMIGYEIDLADGFPLLTTKKINWKNIVAENLWFLSGERNIDLLRKHNCKFWDSWVDEKGNVPSAYGNLWRHFPVHGAEEGTYTDFHPDNDTQSGMVIGWNDQIEWVVDELRKNPMSRRLAVTAWAPGNAQTSKLPPCHLLMVWNVQMTKVKCQECDGTGTFEITPIDNQPCAVCNDGSVLEQRLCLHLTQRSCDIGLGVPYNIAGYAFLLELMGKLTGIKPGIFGHTLVDAHAYTCKPDGSMAEYDHVPGLKEQLTRELRPLPRLMIADGIKELSDINKLLTADTDEVMDAFHLDGYNPHPAIRFKVAV